MTKTKKNNSAVYMNNRFRFTKTKPVPEPIWPTELQPRYVRLAPGNNFKLNWTVSLYRKPATLPTGAPLW